VATGTVAILGSGEVAPSMVKVYRELLERLEPRRGVMLDSPFGFQENVPQLTSKIVDYFATSLQVDMEPASLLRFDDATDLERASFTERVSSARFVFAGPGSPSYAMRQWGPIGLEGALAEVLARGGVVSFASAAALTLGRYTAPIYELYKVGDAPYWLDGLNVLELAGLDCVVIPHYDNAEGQNHDTRFCYLGERRLLALESMLDEATSTLGIDEHTAVVIDLAADRLAVRGRGGAHWRHHGETLHVGHGESVELAELRRFSGATPQPAPETAVVAPEPPESLAALGETACRGGAEALRAIAKLVHLAESGGAGRIDPAPLIEGVLKARAVARESGNFDVSDALRDALTAAGVEVRDSPDGATWSLRGSEAGR
jgi:hypothetical protein